MKSRKQFSQMVRRVLHLRLTDRSQDFPQLSSTSWKSFFSPVFFLLFPSMKLDAQRPTRITNAFMLGTAKQITDSVSRVFLVEFKQNTFLSQKLWTDSCSLRLGLYQIVPKVFFRRYSYCCCYGFAVFWLVSLFIRVELTASPPAYKNQRLCWKIQAWLHLQKFVMLLILLFLLQSRRPIFIARSLETCMG